MKTDSFLLGFYSSVLQLIFPNKCVCCGEIIGEKEYLCGICNRDIERIKVSKRCYRCGLEKQYCTCKKRVYYFESIISLFEYNGLAKDGIAKYKFGRRSHYGEFFATQMALAVKNEYKDIKFDFICCVPTAKKSKQKYGFDHTKLLCEIMSDMLKIPMYCGILKCNFSSSNQHTKSRNERFSNVSGKYCFTRKVKCKNVLLIDDIKTTGATLDECAKQLLFAGADRVYCVTALADIPNNTKLLKKETT